LIHFYKRFLFYHNLICKYCCDVAASELVKV